MHKKIYHKKRDRFSREIYRYCDENEGCKVLFPVFMNLYSEGGKKNRTTLASYTSEIVKYLIQEGTLKEINRPSGFDTVHGLYQILEHKPLIKQEFSFEKYNFDFTQGPL